MREFLHKIWLRIRPSPAGVSVLSVLYTLSRLTERNHKVDQIIEQVQAVIAERDLTPYGSLIVGIYQNAKFDPEYEGETPLKEMRITNQEQSLRISMGRSAARFMIQLIFNLKPRRVLEIGTAYGISGSYIVSALEIVSGEEYVGVEIKELRVNLSLGLIQNFAKNVKCSVKMGDASDITKTHNLGHFNLFYIDGLHLKKHNQNLFSQLLKNTKNGSVFVFDDIHSTNDMREFWWWVKEQPNVLWYKEYRRHGILVINHSVKTVGTLFRDLVLLGHTIVYPELSTAYLEGIFFKKDYKKAFKYAQEAYLAQHWQIIPILAKLYKYGKGVEVDVVRAAELYREGIEKIDSHWCYLNLGKAYIEGLGVSIDRERGKDFLFLARDKGNPEAENVLRRLGFLK